MFQDTGFIVQISDFLLTQEAEARLAAGSFGNGWRQRRCHIGGSAVAAKGRGNPPDEEHAGEHAAAAQDPATVQVAGRNAAATRVLSGQRRRKQRRPSMRNNNSITNSMNSKSNKNGAHTIDLIGLSLIST
jgi:hypothetical protein